MAFPFLKARGGRPDTQALYTGRIGFIFRASLSGGSNLPEALAFGKIAGECAARETPW